MNKIQKYRELDHIVRRDLYERCGKYIFDLIFMQNSVSPTEQAQFYKDRFTLTLHELGRQPNLVIEDDGDELISDEDDQYYQAISFTDQLILTAAQSVII